MEAGRALDALIAEKVMGWHRRKNFWATEENWDEPVEFEEWSPSTNIVNAMDVVKALTKENCNEGIFGECDMHKSDDYWCVRFEGMESYEGADDLPLAICRAALAKVGYKETTA